MLQAQILFGFCILPHILQALAITNHEYEKQNFISEEERRGAERLYPENDDLGKSNSKKRGIILVPVQKHVYSSGYDSNHGYDSNNGYDHGNPTYYYGSTHGGNNYHDSGGLSTYGFYHPSGHGSSYGHHDDGYGYHGNNFGYQGDNGHGHHAVDGGKGHGYGALGLKGLLIPLAGIALLGAAAALSTNPVLLQLGVLNGRRRRRRSLPFHTIHNNVYPSNPLVKPSTKSTPEY